MSNSIEPDKAKDIIKDNAQSKITQYEEAYYEWLEIKNKECQCGPNICFNCNRVNILIEIMASLLRS